MPLVPTPWRSLAGAVATLVLSTGVVSAQAVCGTPGKDGPGGTLSGIVNTYFPGSAGSAAAGAKTITVGTSTGAGTAVAIGDLLLVMQMQDAQINAANTSQYGGSDGSGTGSTSLNNVGRYEYVTAASALGTGGGTVTIRGTGAGNGLLYTYTSAAATTTFGQRTFQVIRVPQYSSAALSSGLTASYWNGATGGVLAIDVAGTLTLGGTVSLDGRGFRGGLGRQLGGGTGGTGTDYRNVTTANFHGIKGEGIAGTQQYYYDPSSGAGGNTGVEGYPSGATAQGAPGNAGGGGTDANPTANDQNSGGGGGANGGAGGKGGFSWATSQDVGGRGGAAFAASLTRIIMGGGGGAGARNNSSGVQSSGGPGGGMVLIRAGTVAGSGTITANGQTGVTPANDGGGGGGAGGTIVVLSQSGSLSGLTAQARGGDGTNADPTGSNHGPGGGGSGGVLILSSAAGSSDVGGGAAGYTVSAGNNYGAVGGSAGTILSNAAIGSSPGTSASALCVPSLTVTKTTSTPTVLQTPTGTTATYTITVANLANRDTARTVSLSDALPTNFTYLSSTAPALVGGASRPSTTTPTAGATNPSFGVFSLPGGGSVSQTFTVTIPATVTTGTFQNPATGTYLDPARTTTTGTTTSSYVAASSTNEDVTVTAANLKLTKTHTGSFGVGNTGTYTLTPSNAGTGATAGTITVLDTLPVGFSYNTATGTGWTCSAVLQVVTCTSTTIIPIGANGQPITLVVNVLAAATGTITNTATISGGGEPAANNTDNSASDPTTIALNADVSTTKSGATTAAAGTQVTYTITTTNNGPSTAAGVVVTDRLPTNATFVSASNGGTAAGGTVTWPTIATLANGASVAYTVVVSTPASGTLVDTASSTSTTNDPTPANNNGTSAAAIVTTTVSPSANLNITKTGATTAAAGTSVTYTLTATNAGPSTATNVVVTDSLPAGATFISATGGGTQANGVVTFPTIATLASGASSSFTVTLTAANAGSYSDVALVTSATADPNIADNRAVAATTFTASADLVTTKSGPATAVAGSQFTYTITTTNNGPSTATNVQVADSLAPGTTFVSASNSGVANGAFAVWPVVATLASGGTLTYTVTVTTTQGGTYTDVAASTSATPDPNTTNNNGSAAASRATTVVSASADVAITNTGAATATAGTSVVYTLTATNNGPSTATGVVIVDTLPAGAVFVSASNGGTLSGGVVTWPSVATLANGANVSYTVTVQYPEGGTYSDIGRVTTTTADPVSANDRATATTTVTASADVTTTKSGPTTASAGSSIVYTVLTTNSGPSTATGIVVSDQIPTNATFVSASNGGTFSAGTVTWPSVPTLASGSSLSYTVTVTSAQAATLTDVARSTTTSPDPTAGNNNGTAAGATVTTTVGGVADLVTTKTGPASAAAGSNVAYSVTVTNNGPSDAANVVITDTIPAAATFVSASNGGTRTGSVITWPTLATLASGASVTYTATLTSSTIGSITNIAAATSPTTDPAAANNRSAATTSITASADLSTTTTGPATAAVGANVTYTVVATNNGPTAATNAVVVDTLPAGALFVSASGGGTFSNGIVTFPVIATLANGATATYTVVLQYAATGTFTDIGSVSSATSDPVPANNRSTATTVVSTSADVATTKSGATTATAGSNVTYTITSTNGGPSPAAAVVITDTLAAGITFVSASNGGTLSGNVVTWPSIATLASGSSVNYTVVVTSAQGGAFTDIAASTSTTPDPTPANNNGSAAGARVTTTFASSADLVVTKTGATTSAAGTDIVYTITVTNNGPSSSTNVVVTDTIPAAGASFTSASNGGTRTGSVVTWPTIASIASGANVSYTVTLQGTATGTLTDIAAATSATPDPNAANNRATAATTITASTDLSITNTGPATATSGTNVTYTLVATNNGPTAATNAFVVDTLPAGALFVSASGGGTFSNGVVTFPVIANFAVGGTSSYTVVVQYPATGTYTDIARVSSGTPDPTPANNRATATTVVSASADVVTTKSGATTATAGSNVTYTITTANSGPSAASGIVITDTLAAGVTFVSASNGGTLSGSVVTWPSIATLANGSNVAYTVTITSANGGSFTDIAASTSTTPDATPANNNGSAAGARVTTVFAASADLAVTKSGPTSASAAAQITYTITGTNNGPSAAVNAILRDSLPTGVTFVSASNGGTQSGGIVTWPAIASLANGGTVSYTVTVTVPASGTLTNVAKGSSSTTDPTPGNNDGSAANARVITTINQISDVVITESGPTTGTAGQNLTYTVTVTNNGPSTATAIVASDTLPAGFTFVSATGGGTAAGQVITWPSIATLASGATTTFTFTAVATAGGSYTTIAAGTATSNDPTAANNNGSQAAARVTTVIAASADVVTTKSGPTTGTAGTPVTYTITTVNNGPSSAANVVVTDTLAAGLTFTAASNGGSAAGSVVTWPTTTSLASGATLTYTVSVTSATGGTFLDIAASSSATPDPTPTNNNGSAAGARVSTVIAPSADLVVTKSGPTSAAAAAQITYTITGTNNGPSAAANVVLRDSLPTGVTFVSASNGGTQSGGIVTWPTIASLANAGTVSYTVTVTVPATGTLTNVAKGSSTTADPAPGNNNGTSGASQVVTAVNEIADVVITESGPTTGTAGQDLVYTVTVRNNGPSTASSIVTSDTLPAGLTFISATGGGTATGQVITWPTIGTLASGATTTFTFTARAASGGSYTSIAAGTTGSTDPTAANNNGSQTAARVTTVIAASADVVTTKTGTTTATAGAPISYTITTTNNGPSAAVNVVVTDSLASGLTFTSATNGGTLSGTVVTWPATASLASGATLTYTVNVTAAAGGSYTDIAASSSTTPDPTPANNNGSAAGARVTTAVTASADVATTETGPTTATAGTNFSYTISVTNNGPSAAQNVVVVDTIAPGLAFVSASGSGVFSGGIVTFPVIPSLASGATATYTVTVVGNNGGTYTNIVASNAATADPTATNNNGSAAAARVITVIGANADVATTKSGPTTATAGQSITYTITTLNNGPSVANSVVITDTLATGVTFISATNGGTRTGNVVTWPTVATLANGANVSYSVTVSASVGGSYTDIAASTSTTPDATPGNNNGSAANSRVTTVIASSADVVTTETGPTTATAGQNIVFTVNVTNNGPSAATSVIPTDTLPAGFTFVSATNGGVLNGNVITWPTIASLASGASSSYTFTATAAQAGSYTTIAASSSTTPDATPANNNGSAAAARVTTVIAASADVVATETGPTTGTAGQNLVYSVTITNNGPSTATNVVPTDSLPAGFTFVSASNGGTQSGGVITWPTIATLASGASVTYTFTATASNAGTYTTIVATTATSPDPTATNNNGSSAASRVATVIGASADIVTSKTGPATATAGADIVYTITTLNNGPSTGTGIVITDTLPAGITFVSATNGGTQAGSVVTWPTIASLANGASVSYSVTIRRAAGGTLTDIAASTSTSPDPTPANNNGSSAAARVTTTVAASADVATTKSGPTTATAGSDIVYTITATNAGPSDAAAVAITDTLAAGVTFISASNGGTQAGNVVTWPTIASLTAGTNVAYTVTVRAATGGTYTDIAASTSTTPDPTPGNNNGSAAGSRVVTTVTSLADVVTTETGPTTATAGANFTYTISVTNNGPSAAQNVVAIDTIAPGLTFVSATGGGLFSGGIVTFPVIPSLASGATATFTVTVLGNNGGTYTNIVASNAATADPTAANNNGSAAAARVVTVIGSSADVATTKSGPASVTAGQTITYTIASINNGPSAAAAVVITDTLPAGITFISATNGGTRTGNVVTWPTIASLASGASVSYSVSVSTTVGGSYTDIAASTSTTTDPTPGNNNGSASAARVTTVVAASADVATTETGPTTGTAGQNLIFTVNVTNNGPSAAATVVPTDTLPAGFTFVSATNGGTLNGNVITWPAITTLASGATSTYTFTATASQAGSYTTIASSNSPTPDGTPANNNGSAAAARVVTVIGASADVVATETGPTTGTAGQSLVYSITITNNGPSTATNVVPTDSLPAGFTFVSASNGGTQSGNVITWPTIASLASGASVTYTFTATAAEAGTYTTNVATTATTPDPTATNNNGSAAAARVATVIGASADIATSKSGPATATAGADIVYTITTVNRGPSTGTGIVITDTLPAGVTFINASNGGTQAGSVITWPSVATLANGATLTYTVTIRRSAPGTLTDIAASTSTSPDPTPANNNGSSAAARVTTTVAASADVATTKSGPTTATAGSDITYTITSANAGPSDATGVAITDTLATGVTFVSASNGGTQAGNVITWPTIATLASGTNVAYTVTVRAAAGGSYTDIAASTSTSPDPTPGNNNGSAAGARVTTTVTAIADVVTTETGPTTATAGTNFSYTVTVTNNGPSAAQNVVVIDTIAPGLTYVSATGGGLFSNGIVTFPVIASLAPGATTTFTVTVVGNNGGTFTNIVASNAATTDPTAANNNGSQAVARVTTVIGSSADVILTKSGPTTGTAGTDLVYNISVRNAGPSSAAAVVVSDTLPAGLTFVGATNGGTLSGSVITWPAVATLANGATVTYSVTARGPQGGSYTDIAASTSTTPDPTPGNNNGSAGTNRVTTVLTASSDVAVTKTGPATATAGAALTYTIGASNNGPSTATGVAITDTLPAGLTFVSASNGGTLTGSVVTWPAVATLASGANVSYTIVATAAASGTYVNVAAATTTSTDPSAANNRATQSTAISASADLATTKTGPATAIAGQNIVYSIATTNGGPSAATNVVVVDTLPAGTTFIGASNGGLLSNGIVTWPVIASLANGATATFTVTIQSAQPATLTNIAASSSATPDPNGGNNRSTTTTAVSGSADLALTKTGAATAIAGAPITYTLAVSNAGPSAATAVIVTDTLPVGLTFVSASNGGTLNGRVVTWPTVATLASAATLQYTVTATGTVGGSYTDVAVVTSPTSDPTPGNNRGSATTVISASADLATTKTGPATAAAGANVIYTIATVNNGPSAAANVVVTDTLPAGTTFIAASNGGTLANGVVTWPTVATLATGATQSYTVTIVSTQGGTITNIAASTSATPDATPANNRGTATTTITATADLATTKSGPATAGAGSQITYTITTINNGPSAAAGVIVRDSLPAGTTFISASNGATQSNGIVTWPTVASLANGATLSYTVVVTAPGVGPITNVAKSTSTTTDPTPGNNDGSAAGAQVVTAITQLADVMTSKTGPARVEGGGRITYTIVSKNLGPSPAQSVVITDQLPSGVTFISATNGGTLTGGAVTWPTIGSLAVNDSVSYQLVVTAPTTNGPITNIVRSTAGTTDPVPGNNDGSSATGQVVTQVNPVDVAIAKSHVGNFGTGTAATYTLTVTNVGPVATTGPITVLDSLPTGLTYRSGTGNGWNCVAAGQVVSCTNPAALAPAATSSIALLVNVGNQTPASVINVATVQTAGDTIPGGNNRATDATTVVQGNPLAIQKTASKSEVEIADVLDYTVAVRNLSSSPIPDVVLNDILPKGFSYQQRTARIDMLPITDPSGAPGPNLTFTVGTLEANQTVQVTYRVRVGAGAKLGDGTNRAIARSTSTGAQSTQAVATVKIVGGVFTDRAYIIGKVYADCDCDGDRTQSREDVGIPGVRVFLEDGTSAVTDVEGKYNFYGVTPRTHVVKVDPTTVPEGGHLVILADRNLGDAGSQLADITNGELHKVDFAIRFSPDVISVIKARRERGEVYGAIIDTLAGTNRHSGIDDEPLPVGSDRPVIPVTGISDTAHGNIYRELSSQSTAVDETSRLPITRLSTAPAISQTTAPSGSIEVTPARRSVPADGNTAIAVRVRLFDVGHKPATDDRSVTLEASLGRWLVEDMDPVEPGIQTRITHGESEFTLVAANQAGVGEIRATSELLVGTVPVAFVPALRPLLVNGLVEGRIDLRSLGKDGIVPTTSTDAFERQITDFSVSGDSGKVSAGIRSAMFLRGKIKGSTLLTLAYDTQRETDGRMFRDIQPDAYYPVYGDASIKEYGAQSFDRLYVRIDQGRSFALYGDYVTPNAGLVGAQSARQLGAYNRSLTGEFVHAEGKQGQINAFASRDNVTQVVDEIRGLGISGPYQLSRADGRLNSEKVELLTRDRNQPSRIINSQPLTRFTDYTLEAYTGRLLFFTPVPSVDQNLNPISIRVTYEVEQAAGGQFWVYGADGQLRLGKSAEIGGNVVRDDDPFNKKQLYSFNASAKIATGTIITGEVARTAGDSAGSTGNAGRIELRHASAHFALQAWGIVSDTGYSNASSTFQRGREELGFRSSVTLNAKTRLLAEGIYSEDRIGGGHRTGGSVSLERKFGKWVRAELGYRYASETTLPASGDSASLANIGTPAAATPNETNVVRSRVTFTLPNQPRASFFTEFEQDLKNTDQRRLAFGGEYVLMKRLRLYGRHEWISSFEGPYALNGAQYTANTVIGLDAGYTKDGQVFSEYRARDAFSGREAEAAMGVRNRWHLARGLTVNTSFERIDVIKGTGTGEGTAVTAAIEYTASPLWRATARFEYRFAPTGDNLLATLGYSRKLSRDWTVLARGLVNTFADGGTRARNQLGFAWRETDRNRWNALFSYENRYENLAPNTIGSSLTKANIISAHLNWQPVRRVWVSGRYAGKWETDSSAGLRSVNNAHLISTRGLVDITKRWDAGVITSVLWSDGFATRQYGFGLELGRTMVTNLRLAAGYNFFGFRNPNLPGESNTDHGVYVKFGFKFDENLFKKQEAEAQR